MVRWLDDAVKIPLPGGARLGVGVDAVLGALIPGAGDALTATASASMLVVALRRRVPRIVIARMLLNIMVDVIGGVLPGVGDLFDVLWRSNRRNLTLLERYEGQGPAKASWGDYAVVGLGLLLSVAVVVVPIVTLVWLLGRLG